MSVFDSKMQWIRTIDQSNEITIADAITISINKSTEIKNNICQITLKNSATSLTSDASTIIGDYVDVDSQELKFSEDDQIKVWAAFLTDASEFGTEWYDDARLLGSFAVKEYQLQTMENQSRVMLTCVDWIYLLFNSVKTATYGISNNFTAPGIIRTCAREFSEAGDTTITKTLGTDNDEGVYYALDSQFLSEGGYIEDYRTSPTTTLNGALTASATTITVASTTGLASSGTIVINTEHIAYTGVSATTFTGCTRAIDDTVAAAHSDTTTVYQGFPLLLLSKIWKPIFEWMGELSQTENTNYSSETTDGGELYYDRAFLFWADKSNEVHWVYPDDTVDLTITLGEEGRRSFSLGKSVFDAVNLVIYNCGEDMYGKGILYYWYDDTSAVTSLKMRYQPMTNIIQDLMDVDINENTARDTTNQDTYKQFPSSYNMTPTFMDEANAFRNDVSHDTAWVIATSDADYNDMLREACKYRGLIAAKKITKGNSGLRYKGTIALKGTNLNPGDLVKVTNPFVGLRSQLLRVTEVNHTISSGKFETIISVEEDITE